ncbi:hypothetical protein TI03_03440, partial [Achromatium sp. WMS1]
MNSDRDLLQNIVDESPKYSNFVQSAGGSMPTKLNKKRSSSILENHLKTVRNELKQAISEQNRLQEIINLREKRLAVIEPVPTLFLAKLEMLLCIIEPNYKEKIKDPQNTTLEELNRRFDQTISHISSILDPKHLIENKDLRYELTQSQLAVAAKREEVLELRVEQERLTQH